MKKPNISVEVFMSVFKWFSVILLLHYLIFAIVIYSLINGGEANMTQTQSGTNNRQEMVNGNTNPNN